jgi:hypothetical protein
MDLMVASAEANAIFIKSTFWNTRSSIRFCAGGWQHTEKKMQLLSWQVGPFKQFQQQYAVATVIRT